MTEEEYKERQEKLLREMMKKTPEELQAMIDTTFFNDIVKGYVLLAATYSEFSPEQTSELMRGLNLSFDDCTASDAAKKYQKWILK